MRTLVNGLLSAVLLLSGVGLLGCGGGEQKPGEQKQQEEKKPDAKKVKKPIS